MRAGRKRKSNVLRDAKGKSRGEPQTIHPDVLRIRARELAKWGLPADFAAKNAQNALAGFTLGVLRLRGQRNPDDPGGISEAQYEAGQAFQKIVHRHAAIMGYTLHIKTPSFVMVGEGLSCAKEPEEEDILKTRRKFSDCYNALMRACADHGLRVRDVLYGVCIENWPLGMLSREDYGLLRIGLNAVGKVVR